VFVMGVDAGLNLIACLPDYESIVIDAQGAIFYSSGLEDPAAAGMTDEAPPPVPDCGTH